jgi:malyl-CoA/(S)-citramalyl-CoA lyase
VALANELFSPSAKDVEKAKRILVAMDQAQKEGKGAVALDGRLIDLASIRQAEVLVRKAEQVAGGA